MGKLHVQQFAAFSHYRIAAEGEPFAGPRTAAPAPDSDGLCSFTLELPAGPYVLRWYLTPLGPCESLSTGTVPPDPTAPPDLPPGICGQPTRSGSPCRRVGRCPYHPAPSPE